VLQTGPALLLVHHQAEVQGKCRYPTLVLAEMTLMHLLPLEGTLEKIDSRLRRHRRLLKGCDASCAGLP